MDRNCNAFSRDASIFCILELTLHRGYKPTATTFLSLKLLRLRSTLGVTHGFFLVIGGVGLISAIVIIIYLFETPDEAPQLIEYKKLISAFYYNYAMLVLNSFGLQNALERSPVDTGHFFARCHSSAAACATLVRDGLGPNGFLRYSPDSHFVLISYAVLSLLKVCVPLNFVRRPCTNFLVLPP